MEQNTCLKRFINEVWAVMKANMYKKKIQDVDELQECVEDRRMEVVKSACHRLCHQTVALSTGYA